MPSSKNNFDFEWYGQTLVITPAKDVETLRWDLIEHAAEIVMAPIGRVAAPIVVVDLSRVNYFASVFLSLLLRCHKQACARGGELVLAGPTPAARDLLRVTALDTLWAIYDTRDEALDAVSM